MRQKQRVAVVAISAALVTAAASLTANAALINGSSASAFGVKAHVNLLGELDVNLPATPAVSAPDTDADDPDDVSRTILGPIRLPADGSIISDLRVLHVEARRTGGDLPTAHAEAQTAHLALFEQDGEPQIALDAIHSVADVRCTAPGKSSASAEGSRFVNLRIGGQEIDATPPPNTEIPLTYQGDPADPGDDMGVRVILNEQTGADAGHGLIVTMLHVIAYSPSQPNVLFADLRIASAKATAYCGEGGAPTNDNPPDRDVTSDKQVTSTTSDPQGALDVSGVATAFRGDEVTWTITISNEGESGCSLVTVIDTLPPHFSFVRSGGDLTKAGAPALEGRTITWSSGQRWPLPAGGKIVETVTAKVAADAPYGTYTDLVDIDESTCSSFTQGDRGPVDVIPRPAGGASPRVLGRTALPTTGVPAASPIALGLLLTAGGALMRFSGRRIR